MEKQKTIYDLELHEMIKVGNVYTVIKVHGGFIYRYESLKTTNSTFVPYDEPLLTISADIPSQSHIITGDYLMDIAKKQSNEKETD